jgi:nitrite reductase/ring-hydroxylating ferredoxin subunit
LNAPVVWHKAAELDELADGQLKAFDAGGTAIVLARRGNEYGALRDPCPHAGGPLSQGCIENGLLVCPWHGREFDPLTGHCEGFQPAHSFPVEVRKDGIFVSA